VLESEVAQLIVIVCALHIKLGFNFFGVIGTHTEGLLGASYNALQLLEVLRHLLVFFGLPIACTGLIDLLNILEVNSV
jgi:hypothetical protein